MYILNFRDFQLVDEAVDFYVHPIENWKKKNSQLKED